jgi:hypothetical protein
MFIKRWAAPQDLGAWGVAERWGFPRRGRVTQEGGGVVQERGGGGRSGGGGLLD